MRNEDQHHFEIGGNVDEGDAGISLTCLRCNDFHVWMGVSTQEDGPGIKLADLIDKAQEHVDGGCPR